MRAIPILMLTALALLSACGSEDPSAGMRESADRARRSCEEARQMGKQVTALTGKKSDESSIRELCDLADQFEDMARESEQRAGGEAGASDCPAAVVGTVGGCSKAEIKARGDAARALRDAVRDPASIVLSHVDYVAHGRFVCGLVNSKNAYGAMAGNQLFFYQAGDLLLGAEAINAIADKVKAEAGACGDAVMAAPAFTG